jgi:hypothetical protein
MRSSIRFARPTPQSSAASAEERQASSPFRNLLPLLVREGTGDDQDEIDEHPDTCTTNVKSWRRPVPTFPT